MYYSSIENPLRRIRKKNPAVIILVDIPSYTKAPQFTVQEISENSEQVKLSS